MLLTEQQREAIELPVHAARGLEAVLGVHTSIIVTFDCLHACCSHHRVCPLVSCQLFVAVVAVVTSNPVTIRLSDTPHPAVFTTHTGSAQHQQCYTAAAGHCRSCMAPAAEGGALGCFALAVVC